MITTGSQDKELEEAMKHIMRTKAMTSGKELETRGGEGTDGMERRAKNLYEIIHMMTEGEAKTIMKDDETTDGLVAWGRLVAHYDRRTMAGTLREHQEVMSPKQVGAEHLVVEISNWEEKLNTLLRNDKNLKLTDNFKMAALAEMCPNNIRSLVYLQVELTDYKDMRDKVVAWVANQSAGKLSDIGNIDDNM